DALYLSNVIGPRPASSKADEKALRLFRDRFESLGLECRVEEFSFTAFEADNWRLSINGEEAPSLPCVASPSTKDTLTAPVIDVGHGTDEEIGDVGGKIILARIGKNHESFKAEKAAEKGALGMLVFAEEEKWGIYTGRLRYPIGSIPALCISSATGLRLSKAASRREAKASIELTAKISDATGKNLLAQIKGESEEYAIVTAHRDSRPHSPGANDNVSGGAVMMEVARALSNKKLKRSIVLFSTDAEEYGLRGSLHHVDKHRDELKRCVANVNLDSVGQGTIHTVQRDRAGPLSPALNSFVTHVAKRMNISVKTKSLQNGSDCDSFLNAGVPACWIRGWPSTSFNSTTDTFDKLDYRLMAKMANLGATVMGRLAESEKWSRTPKT
ncbi:MAG: M20/M25/M40 family metallo-hydrolase, partial [Thaumarchaeota archaeon]|nr:M20/M25/M40 family metallo-hydrolase [Nitrososphaerota archaeon]